MSWDEGYAAFVDWLDKSTQDTTGITAALLVLWASAALFGFISGMWFERKRG